MRTFLRRSALGALVFVGLAAACTRLPPVPEQGLAPDGGAGRAGGGGGGGGGGGSGAQGASLITYPAAPAGQALAVSQFEVRPPPGQGVNGASVVLVRGEVSDVALRGLAKGEPPKSLLERAVPSVVVPLEGGAIVVSPRAPLAEGAYTLAAGSALFRHAFEVAGGAGVPVLGRVWPPASGGPAAFGVYCAEGALPDELELEAGPALGAFELRRGAVDDTRVGRCVTVVASGGEGKTLPPPPRLLAGGAPFAFLDPAPLTPGLGEAPAAAPAACAPPSLALGPICCEALDDRLVLRPGPVPVLAIVEAGGALEARAFVEGASVLRGLAPATTARVALRFFDAAGAPGEASIEVTTLPERPHVVINEVLADALGPEPESEWVELVNDGLSEVDLAGFVLADGGGEVVLPAQRLAPGGFALLTAEGFVPGAGGDVAPAPAATIVTLPALGKSGLSNAGEALALRAPGGEVVSRFPAAPKPKPGASVARLRPESPDDDAGGFVVSAPGASTPGGPNGAR